MSKPPVNKWFAASNNDPVQLLNFSQIFTFIFNPETHKSAFIILDSFDSFAEKLSYMESKWNLQVCQVKCIYPKSFNMPSTKLDSKIKKHSFSTQFVDLIGYPKDGKIKLRASEAPFQSQTNINSIHKNRTRSKIKVLIVDDSSTVRKLLIKTISGMNGFEIVGEVGDPTQVEASIKNLKPDVMTLDIHMPKMNGTEVLKSLPAHLKIPAVVVTSLGMDEGSLVLEALESGAVDYLKKPSLDDLDQLKINLAEKLSIAYDQAERIRTCPSQASLSATSVLSGVFDPYKVILIGCSTGGPEALSQILPILPENTPPIVVVQHIPKFFSQALAERLNKTSKILVKEAEEGDVLKPGHAFIAPGDQNIELIFNSRSERVINFYRGSTEYLHCPSVDHLFHSAAGKHSKDIVAAILTGMGKDGATGMKALFDRGAYTIAQNEASSVVYGMPKAAQVIGACKEEASLDQIASRILQNSNMTNNQIAS